MLNHLFCTHDHSPLSKTIILLLIKGGYRFLHFINTTPRVFKGSKQKDEYKCTSLFPSKDQACATRILAEIYYINHTIVSIEDSGYPCICCETLCSHFCSSILKTSIMNENTNGTAGKCFKRVLSELIVEIFG